MSLATDMIIHIALTHAGRTQDPNASLCVKDAWALHASDDPRDDQHARRRALTSLAYSVGVFHPDYQRVRAEVTV